MPSMCFADFVAAAVYFILTVFATFAFFSAINCPSSAIADSIGLLQIYGD